MQPYPELAPFDRSQFEVAIAFFDFLHHVRGAQSSCNHVVSEHLQQRVFSGFSKLSTVPAGSLLKASFVGVNTVKGPSPSCRFDQPAALTVATKVV